MEKTTTDVCIIGAGLTGLCLAHFLNQHNISCSIIEARDRIGGRIYTKTNPDQAPMEMGATWLGKKHNRLIELLQSLGLEIFEQKLGERAIYEPISTSPPQLVTLPPNNDPSYRIQGGTAQLINKLHDELTTVKLQLNEQVESLQRSDDRILVKTNLQTYSAKVVVSTLPPYLLLHTISIQPELSWELKNVANETHTWMGDSIKVGLSYAEPFWRQPNSSGTIFSNVGPIPEMYDHANVEDNLYSLKGFLNGTYFSLTKEERMEMVMQQLEKYYGKQVRSYLSYEEVVWRNEPFTFSTYGSHILPHQNNGHSIFRQSSWNGSLYIAGSETAATYPGYMDGAVESAAWVSEQVLQTLQKV